MHDLRFTNETSSPPTALQLARQLLARDETAERPDESVSASAALQRTYARVSDNLRDSIGDDGCSALFARALAHAERDHPALKGVGVDGIAASVETHGAAAVTAAIEALFAAIIDILGRLIGGDMAITLLEDDGPRLRARGGAQAP